MSPSISITDYHGLAKNSVWMVTANLSMVFILGLTVLASRILGDEIFGKYVFIVSVTTILLSLSNFGTTDYTAILCAREVQNTGTLVANTLGLRIPLAMLFIAACQGIIYLVMPEAIIVSVLFAIEAVVRTLSHLFRGVFRARNVFHLDTVVVTLERFLVLICAGVGLFLGQTLLYFALGFLIGRILGIMIFCKVYCGLGERLWIGFDLQIWKRLFRGGFPLGLRDSLNGLSFRLDAIMLGFLRTTAEVGWYGAAYKVLEASFFFREALVDVFQPSISRAFGEKKPWIVADLYGRSYKLILLVGGIFAGLVFVYSNTIVELLFGNEFVRSAEALNILAMVMLLVFGSTTSLTLLDAVESGPRTVVPFIVASIVNAVFNLLLIPVLGFLGAAWSTLVTEAILTVWLFLIVRQAGTTFPLRWIFGPIIAFGSLIIVLTILQLPLIFGSVVGLVSFILVAWVLGVFDETDFRYVRLLANKIRSNPAT